MTDLGNHHSAMHLSPASGAGLHVIGNATVRCMS